MPQSLNIMQVIELKQIPSLHNTTGHLSVCVVHCTCCCLVNPGERLVAVNIAGIRH